MMSKTLGCIILSCLLSTACYASDAEIVVDASTIDTNELSTTENIQPAENSEWKSLFNGKNLAGWIPKFKGHKAGNNVNNTFRVDDNVLTVSYKNWQHFNNEPFGHLVSQHKYKNYRLLVEYRFVGEQITSKPSMSWAFRNNGAMLHSQSAASMGIDQAFPISAEAQLLGGNGRDDRSTGNFCSPSTHIVKNGKIITEHCLLSSSVTLHGDQWVVFEAEMREDGSGKHFINGELVFEYSQLFVDPTDEWGKKWLDAGSPLVLKEGHIAVQAESHPTEFRRIWIKSLD